MPFEYILAIFNILLFLNVSINMSKEGKEGRRSNMKSFSIFPFVTYILKKSKRPFFGAWLLDLVHNQFTPNHGSKGFKIMGPKTIFSKIGP